MLHPTIYEAPWKHHGLSPPSQPVSIIPHQGVSEGSYLSLLLCVSLHFLNCLTSLSLWAMKGIRFFVVFLVLSVSLLCTAEAGRSRTSNQNSFRRAANGIYQTLSSVFGEDNIRGLYKVSVGPGWLKEQLILFQQLVSKWQPRRVCGLSMANRKQAPGPDQQFRGCHFEKFAIIPYFSQSIGDCVLYGVSVNS